MALQMLEKALDFKVFFGGGRRNFYPNFSPDPEYPNKNGSREDGRNLIDEWEKAHAQRNDKYKYVWNRDQFNQIDVTKDEYVLGM